MERCEYRRARDQIRHSTQVLLIRNKNNNYAILKLKRSADLDKRFFNLKTYCSTWIFMCEFNAFRALLGKGTMLAEAQKLIQARADSFKVFVRGRNRHRNVLLRTDIHRGSNRGNQCCNFHHGKIYFVSYQRQKRPDADSAAWRTSRCVGIFTLNSKFRRMSA